MAALEVLVRAGKVRDIGVSDTPAWKVAQANSVAPFRGWSSFIGLQIEYSLLERSVEQEPMPMAQELGLGIAPWSPLKAGALSGKYTRKNAGEAKPDHIFSMPARSTKTICVCAPGDPAARRQAVLIEGVGTVPITVIPRY